MSWLIRQWHRFQLARELLKRYEYEEAHRQSWPEAIQALTKYSQFAVPLDQSGADAWKQAVEIRLAVMEATRGTEAS